MLSSLHIENIAVIKSADIDFSSGFNVLTGETGAGKSIVIDSINLLRGNRFDKELIRTGENKAVVGALFTSFSEEVRNMLAEFDVFPDENDELYIQRIVTAEGKNSVKINGKSISLSLLRDIANCLLTIHGQSDNHMLTNDNVNISLLDKYVGLENELIKYKGVYAEYCKIKSEIKELSNNESERIRLAEMLAYQIADIDSAHLKPDEEDQLLEKKAKIKNIERISKQVNFAYRALKGNEKGNACYIVERSIAALEAISDVVPETEKICNILNDVYSALEDASALVGDLREDDCDDPDKLLDEIESRLDIIHKLKRKYGLTVNAVIEYRENANTRLEAINTADERIAELSKKEKVVLEELTKLADDLHSRRSKAALQMSEKICENLAFLDMPKVKFTVSVDTKSGEEGYEFDSKGYDTVAFLASTNVGEPEMPISKIASGGELARIMLSLKNVIAERDSVQTLIFDEVDTGVSGKTARKIGINLLKAGKSAQVICVTHSAQIASLADLHLLIQKKESDGRIYTHITPLEEEGQITELARILGGIDITDLQRATAKELLTEKVRYLEEI